MDNDFMCLFRSVLFLQMNYSLNQSDKIKQKYINAPLIFQLLMFRLQIYAQCTVVMQNC